MKVPNPHFTGAVKPSGDLHISKSRIGEVCYVYFSETLIEPSKHPQQKDAEFMKKLIEPHHIKTVRMSGDLYLGRGSKGKYCYVYFAGKL